MTAGPYEVSDTGTDQYSLFTVGREVDGVWCPVSDWGTFEDARAEAVELNDLVEITGMAPSEPP